MMFSVLSGSSLSSGRLKEVRHWYGNIVMPDLIARAYFDLDLNKACDRGKHYLMSLRFRARRPAG